MVNVAERTLNEVDVVLWLVERQHLSVQVNSISSASLRK